MTTSIGYALGAGSGLDIQALVTQLSNAAKAPKEALLTNRETANEAKISGLAQVSSAIDSFASALSSLVAGGTLFSQPSVSDTAVFTASALAGARLGNLSASVEVRQLAQAQTSASTYLTSGTDAVGEGTLTFTAGGTSFDVTIDSTNNNLNGLAKAINDKNKGLTATVVTDSNGARLVVKGKTGGANAFTATVPGGTTSGLERFATDAMTTPLPAQDAIVRLDGVEVTRATNSFSDLIAGVQIDLKSARPGTAVSVGVTRPTAAINQGVQDFVSAYNELVNMIAEQTKARTDSEAGGALRGDVGVRELQRKLSALPTTILSSTGTGPHTLAEIGVRTNRDGTLSVDSSRLASVLANDPDGVEALFNPGQYSSSPFLTIKNLVGKVAPGTYTITNVVPAAPPAAASGKVNGVAMTGVGTNLVAPSGSPAIGMILGVSGAVTSATITVDPGLGGALQSIRDALRASGGAFAGAQERLSKEADRIAEDREKLEVSSSKYYNQLLNTFTAMDTRVSAFKATQSYLDQQIKIWTNSNN